MTVPTRTLPSDALATPWAAGRVHLTSPVPVSFSDLAATRAGDSASGTPSPSLETPWQDVPVRRPALAPVSFSALAAPISTGRHAAPLTIRSAFVPRPRSS